MTENKSRFSMGRPYPLKRRLTRRPFQKSFFSLSQFSSSFPVVSGIYIQNLPAPRRLGNQHPRLNNFGQGLQRAFFSRELTLNERQRATRQQICKANNPSAYQENCFSRFT